MKRTLPLPADVPRLATIRTVQHPDTLMHIPVDDNKLPARVHTKWRLKYHARIQKKWNKRYGYRLIARGTPPVTAVNTMAYPQVQNIPRDSIDERMLRPRPRQRTPRREDGHHVDPEQNRLANGEQLIALAVKMLRSVRESTVPVPYVHFRCANQDEVDFLRTYMDREAPALPVTYEIVGHDA